MPWHTLSVPSIQIGTLHAVLTRAGLPCRSHSLHVEFMEFLSSAGDAGNALLTPADYSLIGDAMFMEAPGEWVFAIPPVRQPDRGEDKRYLAILRKAGMPNRLLKRLPKLRERVGHFLDACADGILAGDARVVGFTTTFGQTIASLALAARIKQRDPSVSIVFGGANCEASMGVALHRTYGQWIDVVVRGEGELVVPELMTALLAGDPVPRLPGLCYFAEGEQVVVPTPKTPQVAMNDVPAPDYDEYFASLARSRSATEIVPVLPYESSRGCWWGEKSQCSFCGLNGSMMNYRAKSPERVQAELFHLSARHQMLDFTVVDNILNHGYFATLLPDLRARRLDLKLFYQTKANLSRAQVRALSEAGVSSIRPGIESLSTPILQLMRKGVSALQNIRLMKWCAQYGVHVAWNFLYGSPNEPPREYARVAEFLPWLFHLSPPSLSPLTLDRFSPYHDRPAEHGIEILGPPQHYRALYDLPEDTLAEIAWTFDYSLPEGQNPEQYIEPVREQVVRWRQDYASNQGALTYQCGPSFLVIEDRRTTVGRRRYTLSAFEAAVYLACDAGRDVANIARDVSSSHDVPRVQAILDDLLAEHLVYEEAGQYLSLAVATTSPEDAPRSAVATGCSELSSTLENG